MRDIVDPLKELGANLVAITPQIAERNIEMTEKHRLNFDMLSDPGNVYAEQLGIKIRVSDAVQGVYNDFGIDIPAANGDDSWTLPMPTRLVVDTGGTIRSADIDPNHTTRPEPQKTVDDVKALG